MFKESSRPYLWMLLGSFFFAWMAAAAHSLRANCEWQVIALARSSLPLTCALLLALTSGARLVFFTPRILWLRSIAGSVSLVCTFFALTRLPPSHVFTLTSTFPIWVALLSWPLYSERPSLQVWLSVAGSVLGVALMELSGVSGGNEETSSQHGLAIASTLIASFTTAVAMLGLHRLRHLNPWAIVVHFSAVALMFSVVAFLMSEDVSPPTLPQSDTLLPLLSVGAAATIGQWLLTKAFAAGPPAQISVVSLTQVVFAMILDVAIWHRQFSPLTLAGMALVVAPTAWLMASQKPNEEKST